MKKLASLAFFVSVVAFLWVVLSGRGRQAVEGQPPDAAQPVAPVPTVPSLDAPPIQAAAIEGRQSIEVGGAEEGGRGWERKLATVRGRFLLPGGSPAAGVELELIGWHANQERVLLYGVPEDWQDPEIVVTGDDGRFRFAFDPPAAFQFALRAKLAGFGEENWRWNSVQPGGSLDLGETTLVASSEVTVRIVDRAGEPLPPEGWSVSGRASARPRGHDGDPVGTMVWGEGPDVEGRFHLSGLPPGMVQLHATSRIAGNVEGPVIRLPADENVEAEIRYGGPDLARRIRVICSTEPFHVMNRDFESVRLLWRGRLVRDAAPGSLRSSDFVFDDLDPGSYTLEIEDPRFRPWSLAGVEPGNAVRARLQGNVGVALSVSDRSTGKPIDAYRLLIRFDESVWRPREFEVKPLAEEVPEGGLFDGLFPVPSTLMLSAPGYADIEVSLPDLVPNEVRTVGVAMIPGVTVRGRFTNALDGRPIPDARVALMPPGSTFWDIPLHENESSSEAPPKPAFYREATSDPTGHFELPSIPPGRYALVGVVNSWQGEVLDPVQVAAGEDLDLDLELVARSTAGLRGHLLGPEGADYGDLLLGLSPRVSAPRWLSIWRSNTIPIGADGSFSSLNLPPGVLHLTLKERLVEIPSNWGLQGAYSSSRLSRLELDLGDVSLIGGEVVEKDLRLPVAWPGACEVRVADSHARPVAGVVVECVRGETGSRPVPALTGDDGIARIPHIVPGSYTLFVRSPVARWGWNSGTEVLVTSNETSRVDLEVRIVRASVRLLDARDGSPLAHRGFSLGPPGLGNTAGFETDGEGRSELELPIGLYRVALQSPDSEGSPVELEWTASGASPEDLPLEP